MDLETRVKMMIGDCGPQLPETEYWQRIDDEFERMTCKDLLRWISLAIDDESPWAGDKGKER